MNSSRRSGLNRRRPAGYGDDVGVWSTIVLSAAFGFNPSWPAEDASADLRSAEFQPSDPAYAPWARGLECSGQFGLYGFAPPCAPEVGAGAGFDRAWLLDTGRPDITIAIIADGLDLADPDLAPKIRLNPGELSPPPDGPLDRNQDGVVTVLDFVRSSSTADTSIERVIDPRLLARADRGDLNQNQRLDPLDLIAIFSNGVDDDGNGLADDIAGWDFVARTSVPASPRSTPTARAAAAQTNDGRGEAGACPGCTLLPVRVADVGRSVADRLALGIAYAASRGADVLAISGAVAGPTPALLRALAATDSVALLDVGRTEHASARSELPWLPGTLRVAAADPACSPRPPGLELAIPATGCQNDVALGLAAGAAGLVRSTRPELARDGVTATLLEAGPRPVALDARAALERAAEARPYGHITAPAPATVLDPSETHLELAFESAGAERFELRARVGTAPFAPVLSGPIEDRSTLVRMSLDGRLEDPAAPPRDASARRFEVRLVLISDSGSRTALERVFYLGTDLDLYPGFPVRLESGVFAGVRVADLDADGLAEIWVAGIDGRLTAIDGRGRAQRSIPPLPRSQGLASAWASELSTVHVHHAPVVRRREGRTELGLLGDDATLRIIDEVSVAEPVQVPLDEPAGGRALVDTRADQRPFRWTTVNGVRSAPEDGGGWPSTEGSLCLARPSGSGEAALYGFGAGRLRSSAGLDVALPASPLHPEGLWGLRAGGPILARLDGEATLVGATESGLFGYRDGALTELGSVALHPALSSAGDGVITWTASPDGPRPTEFGGSTRGWGDMQLDPSLIEVVVADVDGGSPEWIFPGDGMRLFAVSENGAHADGWPKLTGSPVMGPPAVADLDGDGKLEIVAATRDGQVFAWRTRGAPDSVRWAGAGHDDGASGDATYDPVVASSEGEGGCRCLTPARPSGPLWLPVLAAIARWSRRRRDAMRTA